MTCQHAAQHDEVCTSTKGLHYIAKHGSAAIADDHTARAMCRISAFDNHQQLRITDAGFYTSRAYGSGTTFYFHDIGAR